MGYIVEVDIMGDGRWKRSGNKGLTGVTFGTFEEAETAKKNYGFGGRAYRITSIAAPTPKYKVEIRFQDSANWEPSGNRGLFGVTFDTEAAAQDAIKEHGSPGANYRVTLVNNTLPTMPEGLRSKVAGIIYTLSMAQQFITADHVQAELAENAGNRAGSFFRGNPDVRKVANVTVRSKRAGRNGSKIGVYRSKNYTGPTITAARFARQYNAKGKEAAA